MNVLISGSNRRLCRTVATLCAKAGFKVCKIPKAPLQLFTDKECNCALVRVGGIFTGPISKDIGVRFLAQLYDQKIKIIFVDDQSKKYNNLVANHLAEKNKEFISLTLTKKLITSYPEEVIQHIKSKFEI